MTSIHAPEARATASAEDRLAIKALLLFVTVAAVAPLALGIYQLFAILAR
jgi:hypothetical protein